MKIGFLSDLRLDLLDLYPHHSVSDVSNAIKILDIDMLFLNGNTSSNLEQLKELKNSFETICPFPVHILPGLDEFSAFVETHNPSDNLSNCFSKFLSYFSLDKPIQLDDNFSILPGAGLFDLSFWTSLSLNELLPFVGAQLPKYTSIFANRSDVTSFLDKQVAIWKSALLEHPQDDFIFVQHFIPDFYFSRLPLGSPDLIKVRLSGSLTTGNFIQSEKQIVLSHFGNRVFTHVNQFSGNTHYLASPSFFMKQTDNLENYILDNLFIFNTKTRSIHFQGTIQTVS